jgi:hypothetical protein
MSSGDFTGGSASFFFRGDDKDFQRTADEVEKRMGKVATSFDFSGVQAQFSAVGKEIDATAERAVRFGIRLGVLGRLSTGLGQLGRAAEEMSAKFREGEASVGDVIEKLAEAIPFVGGFVTAGRGIRELVTGEKAYSEVIRQQTAQQEKRIEVTQRYLELLRSLQRRNEDLLKGLTEPKGLKFDVMGIIENAQRETEDLPGKLKKESAQQLKDWAEERETLGKQIEALRLKNVPSTVAFGTGPGGGAPPVVPPDPQIAIDMAGKLARLREIDAESAKVRDEIATNVRRGTLTIAGDALGKLWGRFGVEVDKAISGYLKLIPSIQGETKKALDATESDFQKLGRLLAVFRADLNRGAINPDEFNRISFDAIFKTALPHLKEFGAGIEDMVNKAAGFAENIKAGINSALDAQRALRENQIAQLDAAGALGNREAKTAADRLRIEDQIAERRKKLFALTIDPKLDNAAKDQARAAIDALPDLQNLLIAAAGKSSTRTSFEGLADVGRRIQQAAFASDPAVKIAQDQLEQLKLIGRGGARTEAELKKIGDGLKNVGTVK